MFYSIIRTFNGLRFSITLSNSVRSSFPVTLLKGRCCQRFTVPSRPNVGESKKWLSWLWSCSEGIFTTCWTFMHPKFMSSSQNLQSHIKDKQQFNFCSIALFTSQSKLSNNTSWVKSFCPSVMINSLETDCCLLNSHKDFNIF